MMTGGLDDVYRFGYVRPPSGHRGVRRSKADTVSGVLNGWVSLADAMPPAYNQGVGSCTAQSVRRAIQYRLLQQGYPTFRPAALPLYYAGRVALGTVGEDSGAILADVIRAASTEGFAPEEDFPDNEALFDQEPPEAYYRAAGHHRLLDNTPLDFDLDSILWALNMGGPVLVGIAVPRSVNGDGAEATGEIRKPSDVDPEIGWHALCVDEVDVSAGVVRGYNSWGDWGKNGRFFASIDHILDPATCGEIHAPGMVRVR